MRRAAFVPAVISVACALIAGSGCDLNNKGEPPPPGLLYFPTAVALSTSSPTMPARFLYVVSSNFDLRYNAGAVHAFDLDLLDAEIAARCKRHLGPECEVPTTAVLADEALVSPFATAITASSDHRRLYVTTRTEASLTYLDVDESQDGAELLGCGGAGRECSDDHRRGDDPVQNDRRLRFPDEPVGVASVAAELIAPSCARDPETGACGEVVLVAHRTGYVSMFFDDGAATGPLLAHVMSGLVPEPTGIAFDPGTGLAYLSVFDRGASDVYYKALERVGVAFDEAVPEHSFVYGAGLLQIEGVAASRDTRSLAFSPGAPGQALVVSRSPAALLWVELGDGTGGLQRPEKALARQLALVGAGPSRVAVGRLGARLRNVAVVSCFDARQIFVIDIDDGQPLSIVHNLSGPFELAIDEARERLYVADFRSSVVRVIDLAPAASDASSGPTSARIIARIGAPKLVEELQ